MRGPVSDVPMPELTISNTPAALLPIDAILPDPPPVGTWVRLIGDCGQTIHAAQRTDPDGFTLIGRHALGLLDLDHLDEQLDSADRWLAEHRPPMPENLSAHSPRFNSQLRTYRVIDEETGLPVTPRVSRSSLGPGFDPASLTGRRLEWEVIRLRSTEADTFLR